MRNWDVARLVEEFNASATPKLGKSLFSRFECLIHKWRSSPSHFASFGISAGAAVYICKASFKSFVPSPSVRSPENAPSACFIMLIWCTISNSSSERRRHQRVSFTDASTMFSTPCNALWSVWILYKAPFRQGFDNSEAQPTAIYFYAWGRRCISTRWMTLTNS